MREEPQYPAKSDVAMAFGAVIRERRRARNLTQERLAEAGGVSAKYVSLLERGLYQPSLHTLLWMARGLDTSAPELVAGVLAMLARDR